jgi:hypothetical protein
VAGEFSPAGAADCSECASGTFSGAAAGSCTKCATGTSSASGAAKCTNVCVGVSGQTKGTGTSTTASGNALLTIDNNDATSYAVNSTCSGSCSASANVTVDYSLSVPTPVDSIAVRTTAQTLTFLLTFEDGTTSQVAQQLTGVDVAFTLAGPWQNVVAVQVRVSAGGGGPSGFGVTTTLYETRIKAVGLTRLTPCP